MNRASIMPFSAAMALLALLVLAAAPALAAAPLPVSVEVTATGTVFPERRDISISPAQAQNLRTEQKARRQALAEARREALTVAAFDNVPPGPSRDAFVHSREWIEKLENAYLEAVQVVSEETDSLGALKLTLRASVRLADMIEDAVTLAPRAHLAIHPAVRVSIEAEAPGRGRFERLASALRQDLAARGVSDALPLGTLPPAAPFTLVVRPATAAEVDGKGSALALELLGFRGETVRKTLCPDGKGDLAGTSCVADFRDQFRKTIFTIWERQLSGPFELTVLHGDLASEDRGRQIATCLDTVLPGAHEVRFLHYQEPVATYRVTYGANPAYLDQDLRLRGVERLCGAFRVARIEGETVVVEPQPRP